MSETKFSPYQNATLLFKQNNGPRPERQLSSRGRWFYVDTVLIRELDGEWAIASGGEGVSFTGAAWVKFGICGSVTYPNILVVD